MYTHIDAGSVLLAVLCRCDLVHPSAVHHCPSRHTADDAHHIFEQSNHSAYDSQVCVATISDCEAVELHRDVHYLFYVHQPLCVLLQSL